ncbi:threonine dehydratase [Roseospira marina]|uniref:Threonine dehydratase n=1 Tax=Roseospira marina TaxID=140057 RepID=A0A5M6I6K1_9PROT|nr:threonine dehydratase [Roseospira marina]KAA5603864.1 threonine dehydratase [Roseospira marina]MBB4313728.1 threonine dehydratase [Roseospira marina]MBB5086890.1 threonine dehydratase [Roseospira marina]
MTALPTRHPLDRSPSALVGRVGLEAARDMLSGLLTSTAQIEWPLLAEATGTRVIVKHENHNPTGAFKVRGGLVYMSHLKAERPAVEGVVCATRGNHGQSAALAAARVGLSATIVVPHGNSPEKNAAMRAYGAELVEHGDDFIQSCDHAKALAAARGLHPVPSFHPWLVAGVGTYAMELFTQAPDLEAVFVPIGLGSGICGVISARNALGLSTKVYGVVTENVDAYRRSFLAGAPVACERSDTVADGLAVRVPNPQALEAILGGAEDVLTVSDSEIVDAMGLYVRATHNIAEGAGAAPLAALCRYRDSLGLADKRVGLILSGGNADRDQLGRALNLTESA